MTDLPAGWHPQPKCERCARPHRPDLPCWKPSYSTKVCEQTYRAQGRACAECRRQGVTRRATTIDHVVPRMYGGGDEQRNLEPLCKPHNSSKGARHAAPHAEPEPVAGNGVKVSKRFA